MKFAKNAAAYVESPIDGELVVMNIETGQFHALSGVALAIWRLLDDEADPVAIKLTLAERYAVDSATCDAEVDRFLRELEQARLIAPIG